MDSGHFSAHYTISQGCHVLEAQFPGLYMLKVYNFLACHILMPVMFFFLYMLLTALVEIPSKKVECDDFIQVFLVCLFFGQWVLFHCTIVVSVCTVMVIV